MAVLTYADLANQIPTIWSTDLLAQAEALTYWHRFEGPPGSSMPIVRRDDLTKQAGDTIKLDLVLKLTGAGQTGDLTSVEGNEEELRFRQMSVPVTALSHGVRHSWLAEVTNIHDLRQTALGQLSKWLAGKLDNAVFDELSGNGTSVIPTLNKFAFGTATTRAGVADTDAGGRPTLAGITELKAYAQADRRIEPLRLEGGNEVFGFVMHTYAIMQLKRFDTSWAQAQREAQIRGEGNPLFTGAAGMWDGVILYESDRVPRSSNGTVQVADNIFFGAQALSRGYAYYPDWVEEFFDYKRNFGIATKVVKGERVNIYDLTDAGGAADADKTAIGMMVAYSSAVAPTVP